MSPPATGCDLPLFLALRFFSKPSKSLVCCLQSLKMVESFENSSSNLEGPGLTQGTKRTLSGSRRTPSITRQPEESSNQRQPDAHSLASASSFEIAAHIDALKHLNADYVYGLLKDAQSKAYSMWHPYLLKQLADLIPALDSTQPSQRASLASSSQRSSRTSAVFTDPRLSIATTDTTYSSLSQLSRLSTTSDSLQPKSASTLSPDSAGPLERRNSSALPATSFPGTPHDAGLQHDEPFADLGSKTLYPCTCCDKELKTKTYWRAHEEEFHEQANKWECVLCGQVFATAKRFKIHHIQAHGCGECQKSKQNGRPSRHSRKTSCADAAIREQHRKQAWGCGFCYYTAASWEERCDHVASHVESTEDPKTKGDWSATTVVLSLLLKTQIWSAWSDYVSARHGPSAETWPVWSWDDDKLNARQLIRSLEQYCKSAAKFDRLVEQAYSWGIASKSEMSIADHMAYPTETKTCADPVRPSHGAADLAAQMLLGQPHSETGPMWLSEDPSRSDQYSGVGHESVLSSRPHATAADPATCGMAQHMSHPYSSSLAEQPTCPPQPSFDDFCLIPILESPKTVGVSSSTAMRSATGSLQPKLLSSSRSSRSPSSTCEVRNKPLPPNPPRRSRS